MEPEDRLESWKEIAAYLKRDVRTVQRWEASEHLPVHRHQHKKRGSVYALRAELDPWLASREPGFFERHPAHAGDAPPPRTRVAIGGTAFFGGLVALVIWIAGATSPRPTSPELVWDAPRLFGEAMRDGGRIDRVPLGASVYGLALSPDGRRLFAQICDPTARVELKAVDVETRTVAWALQIGDACGPLELSADGNRLFLGAGTELVVVGTRTRAVRRIALPVAQVRDIAVGPDGRTVYAAAIFRGLLAVDADTGHVRTMSSLPCPVELALSPARDRLFVNYQCSGPGGRSGHDTIEVIDTRTEKVLGQLKGLPNVGGDLVVTPDGLHAWADGSDACVTAAYDHAGCPGRSGVINVIRVPDLTLVRSLPVGPEGTYTVRLSTFPDGSRIVAGNSAHTTVFNTSTLTEWEVAAAPLWSNVVFSPDGRHAYAAMGDQMAVTIFGIGRHSAPPRGLTARWTADGTGRDGAAGNDIPGLPPDAFGPGRLGLALRLDGHRELRLARPSGLDAEDGRFTFAAWFRAAQVEGARSPMTLAEYAIDHPQGVSGWRVILHQDGRLAVCTGWYDDRHRCHGSGTVTLADEKPLMPDAWHHVALVQAGDTVALYRDGRAVATTRVEARQIGEYLWLRLGSDEAGEAPFVGLLDEVEIYNRPLSPLEILERGK